MKVCVCHIAHTECTSRPQTQFHKIHILFDERRKVDALNAQGTVHQPLRVPLLGIVPTELFL